MDNTKPRLTELTFEGPHGWARVTMPIVGVYRVEHLGYRDGGRPAHRPSDFRGIGYAAQNVVILTMGPRAWTSRPDQTPQVSAETLEMLNRLSPSDAGVTC